MLWWSLSKQVKQSIDPQQIMHYKLIDYHVVQACQKHKPFVPLLGWTSCKVCLAFKSKASNDQQSQTKFGM